MYSVKSALYVALLIILLLNMLQLCSNTFLTHGNNRTHPTWAKEKKNQTVAQWSKLLFSNVKFVFHLEIKNTESLKEEWGDPEPMLLEVQCEVFTFSDDLEAISSTAEKFYGYADFIFQHSLPSHCQTVANADSWCYQQTGPM